MTIEERITCLFYILMRDELPTGKLVEAIGQVEECVAVGKPNYTAKQLAEYAHELYVRLLTAKRVETPAHHPAGWPGRWPPPLPGISEEPEEPK
jgi:hypothetical protein